MPSKQRKLKKSGNKSSSSGSSSRSSSSSNRIIIQSLQHEIANVDGIANLASAGSSHLINDTRIMAALSTPGDSVAVRIVKKQNPKHHALYHEAVQLIVAGNPDSDKKALEKLKLGYTKFLKSKHNKSKEMHYDYHLNIARCYSQLRMFQEALEYANKAMALFPTEGKLFGLLLQIHLGMGNTNEAKIIFEKRLEFELTNLELSIGYNCILTSAVNGVSFLKIDDKFKPDDAKTILQEIADFAYEQGCESAKFKYEGCLINEYIKTKQYNEALIYTEAHSKNADKDIKLRGLHFSSIAYLDKAEFLNEDGAKTLDAKARANNERDAKMLIERAILFLKEIINIYENKGEPLTEFASAAGQAAHGLSKIYEGQYGRMFWNADREIHYLKYSANLGYGRGCNDIGYKYHYGEDVEIDLDLASKYYQSAIDSGHYPALLELGNIKLFSKNGTENAEGIKLLETALAYPELEGLAARNLGLFYLRESCLLREDNEDIPFSISFSALSYLKTAMRHEMPEGYYFFGILLLDGIGISQDVLGSLGYFQKALSLGVSQAVDEIVRVYTFLINDEKDTKIRKKYILEFKSFCQQNDVEFNEDKLKEIDQLNIKRSREIYDTINLKSYDNELHETDRINQLLEIDLETLNCNNLCMLIFQLGYLVNKCYGIRDFYKDNYLKLYKVVNEIYSRLHDRELRFNTDHLRFLISGISHLSFKNDNLYYKYTIRKLFSRAVTEIKNIAIDDICEITLAATRLDSDLNIFENLKLLIDESVMKFHNLSDIRKIQLLYILVTFHSEILPDISADDMKKIVKTCVNHAKITVNYVEANSLYSSLKFLKLKNICAELIESEVLDRLRKYFLAVYKTKSNPKGKFPLNKSKLQSEVIDCLSQIIHPRNIIEEKFITTYPVDALVRLSPTTTFILQVDGPTHFLHGINDITPTVAPRTKFRDDYLGFYYPIIKVDYLTWGEFKTYKERSNYLKSLLAKIEIKPVVIEKSGKRPGLFVNTSRIAFQPGEETQSGALSGLYYVPPSPRI